MKLMIRQVGNIKKLQLMNQMKKQQSGGEKEVPRRLKRSYSNPFVYFSDQMQEQIKFNKPPKNSVIAIVIEGLISVVEERD